MIESDLFKTTRMHFAPAQTIPAIARDLSSQMSFDRLGVALADPMADDFQVLGCTTRQSENWTWDGSYRFDSRETVGAWCCETRVPFIGSDQEAAKRFNQTFVSLGEQGFASHFVMPFQLGKRDAILFLLSRQPDRFLAKHLETAGCGMRIVKHSMEAWFETQADKAAQLDDPRLLPLDKAQALHIRRVLTHTQGMIEGPEGAAQLLKLAPSTLRNRMRKLGIERRNELSSPLTREP